jgi:hypothetical protein
VTSTFAQLRRKAHTKIQKKTEQEFLRDRFKPLNKKFGGKNKKEKVDEDEDTENKHIRLSMHSDENTSENSIVEMKDAKNNGYSSNLQQLATNASSEDIEGASSRLEYGK